MDIKTLTRGEFVLQFGLYLLLIPKTLYKVITKPGWIPDYIEEELRKESAFQFGSFCPPLLFWLIIGVFSYFAVLTFFVNGFADSDTVKLFGAISPWLMAYWFCIIYSFPTIHCICFTNAQVQNC